MKRKPENEPEKTCPPAFDPKHEYDRFLPAALAVPAHEVRPPWVLVSVALANASIGAEAVLPRADEIAADLPGVSVERIRELSHLGAAYAFAADIVERWADRPRDIRARIARARELRRLMLASADALVIQGLFDANQIAEIRKGHGAIDAAADCVVLAQLYRDRYPRLAGQIPFGLAELAEAASVGGALRVELLPADVRRKRTTAALAEATQIRDRLWTLFEQTWERELWRAGAWLFARAVDEHVPSLGSRVRRTAAEADEEPDASASAG